MAAIVSCTHTHTRIYIYIYYYLGIYVLHYVVLIFLLSFLLPLIVTSSSYLHQHHHHHHRHDFLPNGALEWKVRQAGSCGHLQLASRLGLRLVLATALNLGWAAQSATNVTGYPPLPLPQIFLTSFILPRPT